MPTNIGEFKESIPTSNESSQKLGSDIPNLNKNPPEQTKGPDPYSPENLLGSGEANRKVPKKKSLFHCSVCKRAKEN